MLVPAGTSTSIFSVRKRTLGIALLLLLAEMALDALGVGGAALDVGQILTGERIADAVVHAPAGERARDVIELLDRVEDRLRIGARGGCVQRLHGGFDLLALARF